MAESGGQPIGDIELTTEGSAVVSASGKNVKLPCQLSPKTNAVSMTIRWFKETECIYLYENGQAIQGSGYDGRLSLDTERLRKGEVSLILKDYRPTDYGYYVCQVKHGEQEVEAAVALYAGGYAEQYLRDNTAKDKKRRMKSAHQFVPQQLRDLKNQVQKLKERVKERESELEDTIKRMKKSNSQQHKLTQDLEDLRNQVQKLTVQLQERESEVEKINQTLIDRDRRIEEKDQLLKQRERELQNTTKEVEKSKIYQQQLTGDIKLTTEGSAVVSKSGKNVKLPCHLYPKTNAVSMTIRWFKETECIYLYENGQAIKGSGYEGRLGVDTQGLEEGIVSLILKDYGPTDYGFYVCQVKHGEQEMEAAVALCADGYAEQYLRDDTAKDKNRRMESAHQFVPQQHLRDSKNKVHTLKERVKERESELEDTIKQMEKSNSQQHKLTQDLEDLRNQVQKLTVQLQERESEVEKINQTLIDRDRELQNTTKEVEKSKILYQQQLTQDQQDLSNQVEKLTLQLMERECELEKIKIKKDKILEEKDKQLKESDKLQKETEKQLNQKDEELRMMKTEWNNAIPENTQLGSSTTQQIPTKIKSQEAEQYLTTVRTEFIDRVSVPSLNCLMDRLLTKKVINDDEMELVRGEKLRSEKARGIIDMVRKKGNRASLEMIDILEQLDPHISGQLYGYYSTYQEAEAQAKDMIHRDSEDRKHKEELEMMGRFEKESKESLREKEETIQELKGKICEIEYQLAELEKQMGEERDEEKKRELEQELRKESERREEMERELEMFKVERENEKREMEERHRQEIEDMRKVYEGDARAEAERNMMKVILPEMFSSIMTSQTKMQRELERQLEEKNREMKELEERHKLCSGLKGEILHLLEKR